MTIYYLPGSEHHLGARPVEDAFRPAPPDDFLFRMSNADLAKLMERRGQMNFYIGGPPPEQKYEERPPSSRITFSGFEYL